MKWYYNGVTDLIMSVMLILMSIEEIQHHYLEGARHQFETWNDHANLQWFMQRQDLN